MGFQVSPGVNVSEIDLTNIVPAVSTTEGATVGLFRWGPIETRVLVDSENKLVSRFGKPTSLNKETFFSAADFLAYGNKLYVSRVADSDVYNAGASNGQFANVDAAEANTTVAALIARYPGDLGNSLKISVCPSGGFGPNALQDTLSFVTQSNTATYGSNAELAAVFSNGDIIRAGNSSIGFQDLEITNVSGATVSFKQKFRLSANLVANTTSGATQNWGYYNQFDAAPDTSNFHIVVVDEGGEFTGVNNSILEVYDNVSSNSSAKLDDGGTNFYRDRINLNSQYVMGTGNTTLTTNSTTSSYESFLWGSDGVNVEANVSLSTLATGYDLYTSGEVVDISLFVMGKAKDDASNVLYVKDNIIDERKDCVLFVSPASSDVLSLPDSTVTDNIVAFRNLIGSTSYAVIDSGYKRRYDKYNDQYIWTPLNGDVAGLCVRTDDVRDPWFSPAGYNRGLIKNVVKLAWNPTKAYRDQLYKNGINPIITEPGVGTLLFGDKTALAKPSAFDRINVRRLFIVLEKAISTASKFILFEQNDEFTRAQFKNLVEPFLRDVQGRRGIQDFRVVADTSNNTAEVIDRNEFRGDIYIKPTRSINFIRLNFVAVRSGVEFSEIVGSV